MQKDRFVQDKSCSFNKIKEDPQLHHSTNKEDKSQLFLEMFTGQNYGGSK